MLFASGGKLVPRFVSGLDDAPSSFATSSSRSPAIHLFRFFNRYRDKLENLFHDRLISNSNVQRVLEVANRDQFNSYTLHVGEDDSGQEATYRDRSAGYAWNSIDLKGTTTVGRWRRIVSGGL